MLQHFTLVCVPDICRESSHAAIRTAVWEHPPASRDPLPSFIKTSSWWYRRAPRREFDQWSILGNNRVYGLSGELPQRSPLRSTMLIVFTCTRNIWRATGHYLKNIQKGGGDLARCPTLLSHSPSQTLAARPVGTTSNVAVRARRLCCHRVGLCNRTGSSSSNVGGGAMRTFGGSEPLWFDPPGLVGEALELEKRYVASQSNVEGGRFT